MLQLFPSVKAPTIVSPSNQVATSSSLTFTHAISQIRASGIGCLVIIVGSEALSELNIYTSTENLTSTVPYTNSGGVLRRTLTDLMTPTELFPEVSGAIANPLPVGTYGLFINLDGISEIAIEAQTATGAGTLNIGFNFPITQIA